MNALLLKLNMRFIQFKRWITHLGLAMNYISLSLFLFLIIIFLAFNIISVYQRGKKNFDLINAEKEKLEKLKEEGNQLEKDLDYYSSLYFVEAFAKENLSLSRRGERLYKFDDGSEELSILDLRELNTDPIKLEDNIYWWKKIFLW